MSTKLEITAKKDGVEVPLSEVSVETFEKLREQKKKPKEEFFVVNDRVRCRINRDKGNSGNCAIRISIRAAYHSDNEPMDYKGWNFWHLEDAREFNQKLGELIEKVERGL